MDLHVVLVEEVDAAGVAGAFVLEQAVLRLSPTAHREAETAKAHRG